MPAAGWQGARSGSWTRLTTFGRSIGLAFQIQDDILDIAGDPKKLGKSTNSDTAQGKVTYPYLIGMEASAAKVEELTRIGKEASDRRECALPGQTAPACRLSDVERVVDLYTTAPERTWFSRVLLPALFPSIERRFPCVV